MTRSAFIVLVSATTLAAAASGAGAQATSPTAAAPAPRPDLEIGQMAPDFALIGSTRYGVLRDSVRLSSLRGQTVVLAFFYKARSKG